MLVVMLTLMVLSACGNNKQIEEIPAEPVFSPLQLARTAIAEGNDAFSANEYIEAIRSFKTAIMHFTEALPTASEEDSVAYNIEVLTINVAKAYSDMAVAAYGKQDYVVAEQGFTNSIETYKSFIPTTISNEEHNALLIDLYRFLAYTKQQKLEFEAAVKNLDMLLALAPGDEAALNLKFSILNDDIKDQNRAFNVLKEYAEVSQDANAYITLANRYRDTNNNSEAEKYYLKALELRPEASIMLIVADYYRAISEWNKATAMFERVLKTNPDQEMTIAIHRRIGENYSQAGNTAKMIEAFEKYLALERDAQIALLLASQFNTAKNYNKVVQYATMVIGLDARNSDAIMLRGMAYYNLKRMNEAKADFTRVENDPKHGANAKRFLAVIK